MLRTDLVACADGGVVAVEALGRYAGPDGVTAFSSCDCHAFTDGIIHPH